MPPARESPVLRAGGIGGPRLLPLLWFHVLSKLASLELQRRALEPRRRPPKPAGLTMSVDQGLHERTQRQLEQRLLVHRVGEVSKQLGGVGDVVGSPELLGGLSLSWLALDLSIDENRTDDFTTLIDFGDYLYKRREALLAHRTQVDPNGFWMRLPDDVVREVFPWEEFTLARSLVERTVGDGEYEDDLFAGLRESVRK